MRRRLLPICLLAAAALPVSPAFAVVGGRAASEPYPHMTALFQDGRFICGASLVRTDWVLTAAHCVTDSGGRALPAGRYTLDPATRDVSRGQTANAVKAAEIRVHPSYGKPAGSSFDVALMRLERAAPAGAPIGFAGTADRSAWEAGDTARVTGFGAEFGIGVNAGGGAELREVDVPIVSDPDCAAAYGGEFDATSMVCAGEPLGMKDACQGDSGGPLTVVGARGARVLVGVVSFGFQCGFPDAPGVYARVGEGAIPDWLRANLPAPDAPTATAPAAPAPAGTPSNTATTTVPSRPAVAIRSRRVRLTRGGRVGVRITCAKGRRSCRGSVTLTSKGKRAGRRKYRLRAGRKATVYVTVARRARRAKKLRSRVTVASGRHRAKTLRLLQPRR